ncbi:MULTISPECIES: glycosyltransferase family 4 protein [unclassified Streptomyces]|jgi:glycosyltransferase involved in cell wall biosynthesis|uniref:glycosyltransferase family 4 protein n=1 Tax=unclassified Streptomyces TaxID=2593676 RepID=UPI000F510904|nr:MULTISPECIES: glycosyltransferase family 4 protein [unclassified Streptomyces]MDH6449869.1 glycosyltransferase involved in cell wall biosynthesis [Streptomyces sp. SAI-119]MDH6499681.1 glycosyltransferase involved in cell wall biosynthesis [Streptomyces sp. SAI-149]QUC61721.1 glycosyltransferase family 4 protein [Streptomyces sp. A2-16]
MPQHVPHPLWTSPQASQWQPSSHAPQNAPQHTSQHSSALPPPPRRIVFLAHRDLDNPAAGGSELLVDRLADGLTRLGHQVTLLCGGPASYRDYRVVSAGGEFGHYLRARTAFARQVGETDLLVEVCNGMPYLAPLWHHGPTLCLVNHVHTDLWKMRFGGPLAPAARIGRRLEHWALAGAAARHRSLLVAVSPSTAHALRAIGVERDRIRVVHNGVEEPEPLVRRSPEPLFVAVGRLVEYKRIDLLLRLWERVRPVTGGRLVIVGDGPERARLEQLAGPGVEFTGHVSEAEKHRLLCEAWLLLHPSAVEGWGLVVTEAATRKTPTVAFDVPGLRDSVVDGETGVLARGESSFAAAWCTLALSGHRREAMGKAARDRAARYRWHRTVRQFRAVASEAVRGWGP